MSRIQNPLYTCYHNIKRRCKGCGNGGEAYKAKGIGLCKEWSTFKVFEKWALANGYKPGLAIHRVNNDEGYYPANCEFITKSAHTIKHNTDREKRGARNKLGQWID